MQPLDLLVSLHPGIILDLTGERLLHRLRIFVAGNPLKDVRVRLRLLFKLPVALERVFAVDQPVLALTVVPGAVRRHIDQAADKLRLLGRVFLPENAGQPGHVWYGHTAAGKHLHAVKHAAGYDKITRGSHLRADTVRFSHAVRHTDRHHLRIRRRIIHLFIIPD